MKTVKVGAAAAAVLSVAGLLAACGKDSATQDSPVAFSPVTGDQYTANPGAFQTDGVAVPPKSVMMVGDPVAAQAVVNSGLPQGTITSTSSNTTVYYPPVPSDVLPPDLRPAAQAPVPEPLARPANTRPWQYTPHQIDAYRAICDTGRWGSWVAGPEHQTQICWSVYGRQLGVRPWMPGQPRPWDRPGYPKPWFDPGFRADVPVMWIYPRGWAQPRPQPIISVSITINLGTNPYRRVNPRYSDPFYPVWAVTPGRVVDVRGQGAIAAPVYTTTTTTTTTVVSAPVAPGVVLMPLPTSAKVEPVLALPGAPIPGNVNVNPTILAPVPAALDGAVIQAGSRAEVQEAVGTSVKVSVADTATAMRTTTATAGSGSTGTGSAGTGTATTATGTATTATGGTANRPTDGTTASTSATTPAPAPSGARAGDPTSPAPSTGGTTTPAVTGTTTPPALTETTTPPTTVAPPPTTVITTTPPAVVTTPPAVVTTTTKPYTPPVITTTTKPYTPPAIVTTTTKPYTPPVQTTEAPVETTRPTRTRPAFTLPLIPTTTTTAPAT
ncbi:hypothetical protein [Tsukamurella pseudospumae]|uniref:Uncharacterized protein n=1 Tax=Tsukamurella pseudospumae TaxID=239498 RepID=A0A137ZZP3_9ACTN|nr:hypothetical protein [Tsukamurella pseudospumae]KXP03654.1 hypothetical protein AXK60_17780 [Tsukamurella pseudospumae]